MDFQVGFNLAVALCGALGGYVLRSISANLKALQDADTALITKVQGIEVLVAGQYVKQSELKELSTALFARLDKISDKIDHKMDKP